jgi:hypothetical protein
MSSRLVAAALVAAPALGSPPGPPQEERIGALPLSQAASTFAEFEEACLRDGGALWGVDLCGPVLLVDPATRALAGNLPDGDGRLEEREGGVFVGKLPPDQPLANAPIEWAGTRWAMVMVPFLGSTRDERVTTLAHESFHRVQPELGLYVFGEECEHLDAAEGRLWMQLEWNALEIALCASGEARLAATQDGLDFRAARRARFPEAAARENALELREGLASYTGLCIAGRTGAEAAAWVANRRKGEDSFLRSFAYNSGPLHGYLLDAALETWRKEVQRTSDLGAMLAAALNLRPSAERAPGRAALYGGDALRAAEEARERARQERLAAWRAVLLDGPVLVLDLAEVRSGTMDTRKTHAFDAGRTVYTERKLVAAWGTLEVSGGAILEDTSTRLGRVSLRGAANDHLSGEGWKVSPTPGWSLGPGEREGDFVLRKSP